MKIPHFILSHLDKEGDIAISADFDADGKADLTIFRPATATWYILRSSGGVTIQQFGAVGDVIVPSDYGGDGKAYLAIFRRSGGQWWYLRSSDGTSRAFQLTVETARYRERE